MNKIKLEVPFNLDFTLDCGQVFRWKKIKDWWQGVVNKSLIKIRLRKIDLEYVTYPNKLTEKFMMDYFRLDDDLDKIYQEISIDKYIRTAIKNFRGLRLIRQDPWECMISYTCATYANIPRIKSMVQNLAQSFGSKIDNYNFAFPTMQKLKKIEECELRDCKLGFRASRVIKLVKTFQNNSLDFANLKKRPYKDAKRMLITLPGIGNKVADCILLYSLEKLDAFPIDIWMNRCLERKYQVKGSYKHLSTFARNYFGKYAGYAQQYLYYYEKLRNSKNVIS